MQPSYPQPGPYGQNVTTIVPRQHRRFRPDVAAYVVGVAGVVIASVALALFLLWRGSAEAQLNQLRAQIATVANSQASGLQGITTRVQGIDAVVNNLSGWLVFTSVCNQDFTGPNGPEVYYLPCTDRKP